MALYLVIKQDGGYNITYTRNARKLAREHKQTVHVYTTTGHLLGGGYYDKLEDRYKNIKFDYKNCEMIDTEPFKSMLNGIMKKRK